MHASNTIHLDIKPILHPISIPFILLAPRDFQVMVPLLPLRHKSTAAVLSNMFLPSHLNLLWLTLQLVIHTKCVHIWFSTIGLAGLAELAQREKPIAGQVVDMNLKRL
jgi:hypothetical protein